MVKILPFLGPQTKADQGSIAYKQQAEMAVQKVFETKPGPLAGLESELSLYGQPNEDLSEFKKRHKHFVVVGIGGSSLGAQVLTDVFQIQNFEFIDNVDAVHFEKIVGRLPHLEAVGWIFISKSGGTIETLAALDFVTQIYRESTATFNNHFIVITEKKESDLYNWAQDQNVLFFDVPKSVGGRYSVLSSVGLVPALLMGLDIQKFQTGALKAYQNKDSLVQLTAAILQSFKRDEWITVLWSYSSRLKLFGAWWQQLWAESLAKKIDRNRDVAPRVSTPLSFVGATDQHSTLQQVMEGARDKFILFLRTEDSEKGQMTLKKSSLNETKLLQGKTLGALLRAEAEAIQQACTLEGVSNVSMQVSNLNEDTLGELFMFFQLFVISVAEALNIDAFNQPGVELGKKVAKEILKKS